MRTIATLIGAMLLIVGMRLAMDGAPEAVITIEAWSPQEIHDLGWTTHPSTGLDVVGVGELVYLLGEEASGEEVFLYSWSITSMPAGSAALIPGPFDARILFRPDLLGRYTIQLTITTGGGTAITSVGITAAEYVGVGSLGGATPDIASGQCAACHTRQAADWLETRHASKLTREIDGLGSAFYNAGCIECHTVGYNEEPQADNGGFDDVADDLGWTFPAVKQDGNWQDMLDNYPQLAQLANIQCENCHGPGSLHKGNKDNIALSLDEGTCGRCHEEEPYHVKNIEWKNSAHATGASLSRGSRAPCADCHSGWGFIARIDPLSQLSKTTGVQPISCAVCHDPHDASNEHQLRRTDPVELNNGEVISWGGHGLFCMNCHKSRRNAAEYVQGSVSKYYGPHRSNQADMIAGTNTPTFGFTLPNSLHRDALDDTCVSCHMSPTPAAGEPGHQLLGGHTWNMHVLEGDAPHKQSGDQGNDEEGIFHVAVCQNCHGDIEAFDDIMARADYDGDSVTESAEDELQGLMDGLGIFLPPLGDPEVDLSNADNRAWYADKPIAKKTLYNWAFVHEDGSHGLHNFTFARSLIQLSIDVMKYGVLTEGMITAVTDIPNDQGKQVRVDWTRFGGDGPSDNPVEIYYVWRQVEAAAKADYASLGGVPIVTDGSVAGVSVSFAGGLWTQVGSQVAAMQDMYSANVPTLFDGEDHPATFMVTGHTTTSTIFAASLPASGYSIDNLVPSAPTGFVAMGSDMAVLLQWEVSVDADFDYFELYRSTEPGFDPAGMDPIVTQVETEYIDQAVTTGSTYYYQLVAYDFSGNLGEFTPEISATATVVEFLGEVPTQFDLFQNYPNPFNPTTTIEFAIPEPGDVTITIYDVSGKQVGILVNEYMQPGTYSAEWNAQTLASGVYIYKMVSGTFVHTSTMLLIK